MTSMSRVGRTVVLGVALGALTGSAAASADVTPLGRTCTPQAGVRFCPGTVATRFRSFDGAPIDVDVTLPPAGTGPFPTIAMLHGYGGDKTDFETQAKANPTTPDTDGEDQLFHYNNVFYAQRGYAVVNATARGFGDSCGSSASRGDPGCLSGYIHLKDQRVEARDTQAILGALVDQGLAMPGALGATGISYGGGESIELAYLRDRTRLANDTFVPWRSPSGTPLSLAAAFPRWPWSDLVSSLVPNGRFLDFANATNGSSPTPIGVPIQSYIEGLFALGATNGFYAPPGTDPSADIVAWHTRIAAGDPYGDPYSRQIVDEIYAHHQGYGLGGTPAPLLLESGWTDDLFPPAESLRVYDSLRAADPATDVALLFGDLGHSRGSNKGNTNRAFNDAGSAFFDAHLKGSASPAPPAKGSITAYTQTCPRNAPAGGPFSAASWPAVHPGAVRFGSAGARSVTSAGGNPSTARAIDPIASTDACTTVGDETAPGTAVYRAPKVTGAGYTLMGLPTVQATVAAIGVGPQLDSRLWDVGPDGRQTLVSRGAYRLADNESGTVTFQLHGNGWRFAPGDTPKLELLGTDPPYLQPNKAAFSIRVSDVVAELPTLERPGGSQVVVPRLGRGRRIVPRLRLSLRPARVRQGRRVRLRFAVTAPTGGRRRAVARVTVRIAGRKVRTNALGRASVLLRFRSAGRRRVRADRRGYRGDKRTVRVLRAKARRGRRQRARHR